MKEQFVPPAFAEEYLHCPTCEFRQGMDASFLQLDDRLRQYADDLRRALSAMPNIAARLNWQSERLHQCLAQFAERFRDTAEAHRVADAVLFTLYYLVGQYGLGNRLRNGVSAHDALVEQAKARLAETNALFAALDRAHSDLDAEYRKPSSDTDAPELLFFDNGFQHLKDCYDALLRNVDAFWQKLEPWLTTQRDAAFKIEL